MNPSSEMCCLTLYNIFISTRLFLLQFSRYNISVIDLGVKNIEYTVMESPSLSLSLHIRTITLQCKRGAT